LNDEQVKERTSIDKQVFEDCQLSLKAIPAWKRFLHFASEYLSKLPRRNTKPKTNVQLKEGDL
jgi:hypothetical protein